VSSLRFREELAGLCVWIITWLGKFVVLIYPEGATFEVTRKE